MHLGEADGAGDLDGLALSAPALVSLLHSNQNLLPGPANAPPAQRSQAAFTQLALLLSPLHRSGLSSLLSAHPGLLLAHQVPARIGLLAGEDGAAQVRGALGARRTAMGGTR